MLSGDAAVLDLDRAALLGTGRAGGSAAGAGRLAARTAARGRRWAAIPPLSVLGFVVIAGAAEQASAQALTYLALIAVPLLAALALGWLTPGARPPRALLVPVLFALAWIDRGGLPGEGAALALSALSCVALGVLLAIVTPPRWLAAGIVTMAAVDAALVVSDLLQRPNSALNAASGRRSAEASVRRVRLGGDGLRRSVHRRHARRAARDRARALLATAGGCVVRRAGDRL